ncbi:MAG TPA: CHAT domain-containing protein, partial [Candidatus Methylomirabilis sp.]|nr:CHAT domain-containing protein [Candidatus Methylomirabilis sp.]
RRSHERFVAPQNLRPPDLMLLIEEEQLKGKPALTLRLTAQDPSLGLNVKKFGPVEIEMDPLEYFKDFFNDIEGMPLATEQDRARAQERLAAKGSTLFESVMPKDLQALLWHLRKRIQSVVVQSSEPWIPWELCKLHGRGGNRVIEGPFMCEAFAVTRWLPEIGFKPTLTLKNMALVVPQDSGLWMADSERDYILALGNGDRHVERIPARYLEVRSALSRGTYDAWHFTGHSEFRTPDPNLSPIYLENKEQLTPDDLGGVQKNLGLARPLVFLNACQVGRSEMSLTGMGGWARQFLTADAGAFIGTYWGVYDHLAFEFAKAFYQQLLAGASIGKAAQEARRTVKSIKPPGNPTWLAYAVFADPLARVA